MEFSVPLHLVSPKEKSPRVKDAHWLLSGHNAFQQDFHAGPDDEVFGPQMGGAVRRAKNLIGYPKRQINEAFGQKLYQYLLPKAYPQHRPLPVLYKLRRVVRMRKAVKVSSMKEQWLAAALRDAQNQVHENPPGSNNNPFGVWYGFNRVAWCAIYVTFRLIDAGFKYVKRGSFASYVGAYVEAARRGERHLALTHDPEPGDLVAYKVDEHIAFFVKWIDRKEGTFQDVGGNTSAHDGSPSNGGECAVNTRCTHGSFPATAFIRVGL